jgi:hypothetical protein
VPPTPRPYSVRPPAVVTKLREVPLPGADWLRFQVVGVHLARISSPLAHSSVPSTSSNLRPYMCVLAEFGLLHLNTEQIR